MYQIKGFWRKSPKPDVKELFGRGFGLWMGFFKDLLQEFGF